MFVSQPPLPISAPVLKPPPPPPLPDDVDTKPNLKESVGAGCSEARLIGVISAFLQVTTLHYFFQPTTKRRNFVSFIIFK